MVTPRKTADKKPAYDDSLDDMHENDTFPIRTIEHEPSDDELSEEDALNSVLSELGGVSDAKVNVYLNESGKSAAFVGSYPPDAFSIDAIQASYGAGDYSIQVRAGGRIRARRNIRIAKPRTDLANVNNVNQNEHLIATMQQGFATMLEGLKMLVPQQAPAKTTQELLQELMLMKQLVEPANVPNQGGQTIDDFMKMFALVKEITPREGDVGTNELIMQGLQSLMPVFANARQQQPQQIAQIQPRQNMQPNPQTNPVVNNAPNNATEKPTESNNDMNLQEKMLFNLLIKNAEADNDPVTYANMLLDIAGADEAEKMLNVPDWFETLVNRDARIAPHREWFTELRGIMLETIEIAKVESNNLTPAPKSDTNIDNTQLAQSDALTEKSNE